MKNLINYYYNLEIQNFKKSSNKFLFKLNNKNYEFVAFSGNMNELISNYNIVKSSNKYCHTIVPNKDNSPITFYKGTQYILIEKNLNIEKYVDSKEILFYEIIVEKNLKNNWKKLWGEKIDYYEYQMSQLSIKYPLIKESLNYYIGLTETAITLLNYVNYSMVKNYICHKRINFKEKLDEFLNPINFIIDSRVRDLAEFIKINYMFNCINYNDIIKMIELFNLSDQEAILLLSRLLYPSYYFDLYDKIIKDEIDENSIEIYTKKSTSYEVLLKKIYKTLKKIHVIPNIEWLNS